MLKRGSLNVPVIGVAKAGWNLDQFKARALDSLEKHGGADPETFRRLSSLLRYVDGDYGDPATFAALGRELQGSRRPAHYLAIPPAMFEPVLENLTHCHCMANARMIVEKPFGHDLASARHLNKVPGRRHPHRSAVANCISPAKAHPCIVIGIPCRSRLASPRRSLFRFPRTHGRLPTHLQ
jgi:glucose-6-phosphate 1-dehydrogenase